MTKLDDRGAILIDTAKLHAWDSADSYGVDAMYTQMKEPTDERARAFCFTRGSDSVTVTFKTVMRLLSKYRNCASKYDSYSCPMYTEEQIKAGIHGRIWFRMSEDGRSMQVKLAQPYLGTKEHTIPDESAQLADQQPPAAVWLPAGWVDETALRTALALSNKQITAISFATCQADQQTALTIDKKLLSDLLKPAKGMHLEYRIRIDPSPYQMDAGIKGTYDGQIGITLAPLPTSIQIEYRAAGYKGVMHLGDSHLAPQDAATVLPCYVLALPPAQPAEPTAADYQQPSMLDALSLDAAPEPETAAAPAELAPAPPVLVSNPESETVSSDSDPATAAGVAHFRSCLARGQSINTAALAAHAKAYQYDRAGFDRAALNAALDALSDEEIAACRPAPSEPVSEPTAATILSDSVPPPAVQALTAAFVAHLDTCYSCTYNNPCSTKRDMRARLDAAWAEHDQQTAPAPDALQTPPPQPRPIPRPHTPAPRSVAYSRLAVPIPKRFHGTIPSDSGPVLPRMGGDHARRTVQTARPPPEHNLAMPCRFQNGMLRRF